MEITVLSWNIWLAGDLEKVVEFVERCDADIIGMQEVIPEREPDIINAIEALGYQSAFTTAHERRKDGRKMGNAIFSKFPIVARETYVLSDEAHDSPTPEFEQRVAVRADIDIHGTTIAAFSTHLAHTHQKPSAIQQSQVEHLVKVLPKERAILMGDFNATPESDTIKQLQAVLTNTDPSGEPTWSLYPEGCDTCNLQFLDTRLDYIFTTPDLKTHSPKVERSDASDHLPVSSVAGF